MKSYSRIRSLPTVFTAFPMALFLFCDVPATVLSAEESFAKDKVAFELPPVVDATDVIPADVVPVDSRSTANYQISNDVSINDYYYRFHLTTTHFGTYDVDSQDLLQVRIYETNVLDGTPEIKAGTEFGKAAKSDIANTAKAAAKTVVTPVKSAKALAEGIEEESRIAYDLIRFKSRNQPKDSFLTGEEKRKQAHTLGLDVYSSNPAVQEYLDNVAKARSPGSTLVDVGISVTTFVVPFGAPISIAISAGKYREKLADKFDTLSTRELYHYNDKLLKKMNVQSAQREQFLEYAALTPRQKTEIVGDLKTLDELKDRVPFLEACREPHPNEGIWQLQSADMLAKYNKTVEPIQWVVGAGPALTAATSAGRSIVFIPGDIIYWSEGIAKIFENGNPATGSVQTAKPECILTGRATDRAKKEIESRGFAVREHFLREEKQP